MQWDRNGLPAKWRIQLTSVWAFLQVSRRMEEQDWICGCEGEQCPTRRSTKRLVWMPNRCTIETDIMNLLERWVSSLTRNKEWYGYGQWRALKTETSSSSDVTESKEMSEGHEQRGTPGQSIGLMQWWLQQYSELCGYSWKLEKKGLVVVASLELTIWEYLYNSLTRLDFGDTRDWSPTPYCVSLANQF